MQAFNKLLPFALMLALGTPLVAQSVDGKHHQISRLDAGLHLTPEQRQKILKILQDTGSKKQTLLADQSATPAQRDQKLRELHAAARTKIRALLTPAQQKTFDTPGFIASLQPK